MIPSATDKPSLDLAMIGNCSFAALVDRMARIVWCCLPRFDGDPVFHSLLGTRGGDGDGAFSIELDGVVRSEQHYLENTAVVVTRLHDASGNAIEITDFAPRFQTKGRMFRPTAIVRRVRPVAGHPRIRVRCRPRFAYGARVPDTTFGSNHVRWVGNGQTLRLTTNAPVTYVRDEIPFLLDGPVSFYLGRTRASPVIRRPCAGSSRKRPRATGGSGHAASACHWSTRKRSSAPRSP